MLFAAIIGGYCVANLLLATIVLAKSPRNTLSQFYAFCVGSLVFLGVAAALWVLYPTAWFHSTLEFAINFIYALFPFFFLHFIVLFARRYEVLNSRLVILSIYGVGIFGYTMIVMGLIPKPLSDVQGVAQSAYVFYLTWLTIFFTIGIAMLYEVARGFYERAGRSRLLFGVFALLLMLLPGPFTESVFFGIFHLGPESYYISCTIALTIAVYFIFRHKIIVNTQYDELKSALAALNDIFITTDEEFRIEMVRGTAVMSVLGYAEKEMLGRPMHEFLVEPAHLANYKDARTVVSDQESYFDSDVRAKNGTLVSMNFSVKPMLIEKRCRGFVSIGRDMTERKRMEAELRQSQKMESIGTLAGGVAHDVNNILQIILINTMGLQRQSLSREKLDHIIDINMKAVERGSMVVQQILTFARKTPIKFEVLDLNTIIEDLVSMLSQTFPRTIEFASQLDPRLPSIVADGAQMNQVLLNLCINARDAMPAGGQITIQTDEVAGQIVQRSHTAAAHGRYVRLSVADTGTGMDENTRLHIFDPFFTTKGMGKGTGLGLSVVYGIVQTHHGIIDVQSTLGKGTRFDFYIPVSEEVVPKSINDDQSVDTDTGSGTILIVEDEEVVLSSLALALEQRGFAVIVARDGLEGVEAFKERSNEIGLVILDIGLPKLNGWDAFLKMKEINRGVRSIISSGYLDPKIQSIKGTDGVVDYVLKPYAVELMLASVQKAFRGTSPG